MAKVSVVIPTFQRCNSLKSTLLSLNTQMFPPDEYEVIVSIDGSEDGTREMVDDFKSPYKLRYIWTQNSGRASACNRGIEESSGEVIIIIDDDMSPSPKFVEAHYLAHMQGSRLCVLGAAPIIVDESSTVVSRFIARRFNSRLERISEPGYRVRSWDFYGGNFSIRKDFFLEVGAFNETFKIYGYEDIELAQRIINSGGEIVYSPQALCIQNCAEDFRSLAKKMINNGKSAVLHVKLHPDTFEGTKVGEYNLTGWKWRYLRLFLIRASIAVPLTADAIIFFINLFEKFNPKLHEKLFCLAMDYFEWLGVWTAIRNDKTNKHLIPRIKSYKKTQTCPSQ